MQYQRSGKQRQPQMQAQAWTAEDIDKVQSGQVKLRQDQVGAPKVQASAVRLAIGKRPARRTIRGA